MYVIYCFRFFDNDGVVRCYVGCTINMRQRESAHKSSCYNPNNPDYNKYAYRVIREHNINWKDVDFDICEVFTDHESKAEKEDEWICNLNGNLNMRLNDNYSNKKYTWEKRQYICECGSITTNRNKDVHRRTNKHYRLLENLLNVEN